MVTSFIGFTSKNKRKLNTHFISYCLHYRNQLYFLLKFLIRIDYIGFQTNLFIEQKGRLFHHFFLHNQNWDWVEIQLENHSIPGRCTLYRLCNKYFVCSDCKSKQRIKLCTSLNLKMNGNQENWIWFLYCLLRKPIPYSVTETM